MGKLAGGNENEMKQFCWLERSDEVFMLKTKRSKNRALCSRVSFCSFFVVHPENACWTTLVSERQIQILLLFLKQWTSSSWNCLHETALNKPPPRKCFLIQLKLSNDTQIPNSVAPMTTAKITVVTSSHERCHGHSEELRLSLNNINKNGRNAARFLWMVFDCNLFFLPLGELPLDLYSYR